MTEYKLYNDDCLKVLKTLPDNSIDSCVTDPPYGLSFMGKSWDYDVPKKEIWEEVFRVLKPGGHMLAFFGSRTYHRGVVQIEDAGFEIRDQIMWIYGSGFPKSHNISKAIDKDASAIREKIKIDDSLVRNPTAINGGRDGMKGATRPWIEKSIEIGYHEIDSNIPVTEDTKKWDGWGTALKPAHEPIVVARKPLSEKNIAANVLKYGTGALNIDVCRIGNEKRTYSLKGGENLNKLSRQTGNDSDDAKGCGAYGIGAKQITIGETTVNGRWPANIIHDGSDEVISQFPETKSGKDKNPSQNVVSGFFGNKMSYYSKEANYGDAGSAARFFYCAKASKSDRDEGLDMLSDKQNCGSYQFRTDSSLDGKSTKDRKNNHPTVKPTELMKYLCKLVTPPNGIVLDPFMGSGSTGKAAMIEKFNFVGIEMNKEYYEIAEQRIKNIIDNKTSSLEDFFND